MSLKRVVKNEGGGEGKKNKEEVKILKDGVINFFDKNQNCRSLSNFWERDVVIMDDSWTEITHINPFEKVESRGERVYESGESCYHGEKFIRIGKLCENKSRGLELIEYGIKFFKGVCKTKEQRIIKKMGRGLLLSNEELYLWNTRLVIDVQLEICTYKFNTYEEVRNDLIKSKGKILIHPAMRCSEEKVRFKNWLAKAIVVNGEIQVIGGNWFGNMWMKLRETL
jgi:hypothetical protein